MIYCIKGKALDIAVDLEKLKTFGNFKEMNSKILWACLCQKLAHGLIAGGWSVIINFALLNMKAKKVVLNIINKYQTS